MFSQISFFYYRDCVFCTLFCPALIEKWYTSLKFQLKHITIKEYLVNWWWTNIEYCRGAWYIGHEILRNTFFILRGGPDDSRRNGVYAGSLANQNGNRASMPDLLHDDQPSEVLEQATTIPGAPQARPPSGSKRVLNQIHQAVKEAQTEHEEVEPAFSEEINFPPGWLVFHSRLGVVHKHVADEYDRRRHHLVAEASGARRIKPHVMNTLSPHDSQSPAIGNNGSTPITAQ